MSYVICALLMSLALSGKLAAFTLNSGGAVFDSDNVTVDVANVPCNHIATSHEELLEIVEKAASRFWNTVPTSRLRIKKGNIRKVSPAFGTELLCNVPSNGRCKNIDQLNENLKVSSGILIACNNNPKNFNNSPGVLGVAVPNNFDDLIIKGALILLNDAPNNRFASKYFDEKVSIVAHEIGHTIGLGHSKYENNLMFASSISTRMYLGEDDVDGITWLYPIKNPFVSCTSISTEENRPPPYSTYLTMLIGLIIACAVTRVRLLKS